MRPVIRQARPADAPLLSEIAIESKASWGYSPRFMNACRAELIVRPDEISAKFVRIARLGRLPAGFLAAEMTEDVALIEALFVRPGFQRRGIGRALLKTVVAACRIRHIPRVSVDADPNAAAIYECWGFVTIGHVASGSIPGRTLPRMQLQLR